MVCYQSFSLPFHSLQVIYQSSPIFEEICFSEPPFQTQGGEKKMAKVVYILIFAACQTNGFPVVSSSASNSSSSIAHPGLASSTQQIPSAAVAVSAAAGAAPANSGPPKGLYRPFAVSPPPPTSATSSGAPPKPLSQPPHPAFRPHITTVPPFCYAPAVGGFPKCVTSLPTNNSGFYATTTAPSAIGLTPCSTVPSQVTGVLSPIGLSPNRERESCRLDNFPRIFLSTQPTHSHGRSVPVFQKLEKKPNPFSNENSDRCWRNCESDQVDH